MEIRMGMVLGEKAVITQIEAVVGQTVKNGDELFQVEMQKGVMPVIAAAGGIVSKILVAEGDEVKQGDLLAELSEAGEERAPQPETAATEAKSREVMATELLIIGGGPGGYVAAIYAAKKGMQVTLAEAGRLGGVCLNQGCIPTKALVKSSAVYQAAKHSELYGIRSALPEVDMKKVMLRKNAVVGQLVGGIEQLMKENGITVLQGRAGFAAPDLIEVQCPDRTVEVSAKDVIIATGSATKYPSLPGIDLACVIDSTAALEMEKLPASITIVGGGAIGLEFAFIYANLGVGVTVLEYMDRLLPMLDQAVSSEIERIAQAKGIAVFTSAKVLQIQQDVSGQAITVFERGNCEHRVVGEKVLMAVGRQANTVSLGLENTDILLNEKKTGIQVDAMMKTPSAHSIYAIGDVTNTIQLAHVASHQGLVAVDNILGYTREMDYQAVPNVIFTEPEIASVGKTPADCEREGIAWQCSQFPFFANGKALTMGETEGFVKLVKDSGSGKIIGGSIIGADASALIATITLAVTGGLDENDIAKTIFPHPTTSEAIHEAALGLGPGSIHITQ